MDAEPDFFEVLKELNELPDSIVIDISKPVNRIRSVFQHNVSPEFIVDQAIEACGSRVSAHRDIANFASRLMQNLKDWNEQVESEGMSFRPYGLQQRNNVDVFDVGIVVEQATLDLFDTLMEFKLHRTGGIMPYQFDHILSDGSVLLKKCGSPEELFDRVAYLNA